MIKLILLAVVPFMTQHRNVVPKTEVTTNFYGSVTGVVTTAYIQEHSSIVLPEKWALANVTNAYGKSVRASDVGALGNSGSQTLNQSYGGLSVNFDAEGSLYAGQYAPSKWSITKEANDQYYYVQFFGFNGTNYPSFNLFDGESDFYIRLPRKEGTLALKGDIPKSFATSSITNATGTAIDDDGKLTYGKIRDKNGFETHGIAAINGDNEVYITTDGLSTIDDSGYSPYQGLCVKNSSDGWSDFSVNAIHFSPKGDGNLYYYNFPHDIGTIALEGWSSLSRTLYTSEATALATHPTFSNAVLAVGLNIDTNSVAVLNEIAATFGGFPITGTATTVGGLLAALAAAAAWLKKKTALLQNDGKATDAFATDLLGKQVAKEAVRYAFDSPTSSTTTTGTVETTAVTANSNTVASITIPAAASGNTPSLAITVPDALGPSDVRDLIVYAVNADTANDCPIGIVGGTPVPQDGAEAKVPKGSRAYICVSKMPTTGEWFIQAVKLTAAA